MTETRKSNRQIHVPKGILLSFFLLVALSSQLLWDPKVVLFGKFLAAASIVCVFFCIVLLGRLPSQPEKVT